MNDHTSTADLLRDIVADESNDPDLRARAQRLLDIYDEEERK